MSDPAADSLIAAAIAKRDAALAEVERWNAWLKAAAELSGARPAPTMREVRAALVVSEPPPLKLNAPDLPHGPAVGARVLETEAVAAEIIRQAGNPVPTKTMLEEMTRRGFVIEGKDPVATLTTRLGRAPSLENQRPFGWRLKAVSPEVGPEAPPARLEASESDPATHSSPVEPAAGGGI